MLRSNLYFFVQFVNIVDVDFANQSVMLLAVRKEEMSENFMFSFKHSSSILMPDAIIMQSLASQVTEFPFSHLGTF